MMEPGENQALYLFYLTGPDGAGDVEGSGVTDADPLFAHRCADFTALLSLVSLNDFCGPDAERKLSDLGWVSERALRHERVIEQGFRRGPVLPMRFGTLFSSMRLLERFVEQNRQMIARFLCDVRGQEEWGVKALLERSAAKKWLSSQVVAAAPGETPMSPGLRYMQQRRAEAAAEKELQRWLLESCRSVARSLSECAADLRERKILDDGVAGDSIRLVMNLATLISRHRRTHLVAHIEKINRERAEQGLSLLLSGPWPPYSFCPPLVMPAP
jgi:gas vesicle protein GvpL/GvpF